MCSPCLFNSALEVPDVQQREIEDVCAGKEGGKLPLFVDSTIDCRCGKSTGTTK